MMFNGTIQMRVVGTPRRKAGVGHNDREGGDYYVVDGIFWKGGHKPCRCSLIILGSDFRALDGTDWSKGGVLTASNLWPMDPSYRLDEHGKVTEVVHRYAVQRGGVVTLLSIGGKLLASHRPGAEPADKNRVDRPGQGNDARELFITADGEVVREGDPQGPWSITGPAPPPQRVVEVDSVRIEVADRPGQSRR